MMHALSYLSTRGSSPAVTLSEAIAAGLAPDGGLYVPEQLPSVPIRHFRRVTPLAGTAVTLLRPFFFGDPLNDQLAAICRQALNFPTPLVALGPPQSWLLELFHGPTSAFKDVGARFLAACMSRIQSAAMARAARARAPAPALTILVATSGDTGAAVAAAFHKQPGLRVVILYPDGQVSPRQAHQLGAFGDNVHTLKVQGRFDDCQRMVKSALADEALQQRLPMSSANSISLGRLLPQMSYYVHVSLRYFREHGQPLNFIVPTGNLGNALAAIWASKMGLPIGEVRLACNANATLPDFAEGETYRPREAVSTLANAMDVGAPSNFERLRWTFPDEASLRTQLHAQSVDDISIRETLKRWMHEHHQVVCPHTATGLHLLDQLRANGDERPFAVAATAHPAKFEQVIEPLLGRRLPLPPGLAALLAQPAAAQPLAAEDGALKHWLLRHFGQR